jgi:hypothetical protein
VSGPFFNRRKQQDEPPQDSRRLQFLRGWSL